MDEQHKQPRIIGLRQYASVKLPRRTALKGLSALAVAAVGCGTERTEPTADTAGSAGKAAAPGATGAAAGSRATTSTNASTAAGARASASGAGAAAPAGSAATAPAAGSVATPAGGAGATATSTAGSAAGSAASGGTAAGSSAAGSAAGASGAAGAASPGTSLAALQCIVTPAMTEGPFFVEEKLQRSNLVMGETEDAIVKACPLKLVIGVYQVDGMQCTPLPGVNVDIWHADALGVYSDIAPGIIQSVDTRGKKFLRGYQVTDEVGIVQFETIYPGWYMSRTIHVHFKLRQPAGMGKALEFTSQMFFDEAINAKVLAMGPYTTHPGKRDVLNDDDHIFNGTASNGQKPPAGMEPPGKSIMPTLVADGSGYIATLKLGIRT